MIGPREGLLLALLLVTALAAGPTTNPARAQETSQALERVSATLEGTSVTPFVQAVLKFAMTNHIHLTQSTTAKNGRPLVTGRLQISDRTFFSFNNFRSAEVFEITAYSEEGTDTWRKPWAELVAMLSAKFGESRVVPVDAR